MSEWGLFAIPSNGRLGYHSLVSGSECCRSTVLQRAHQCDRNTHTHTHATLMSPARTFLILHSYDVMVAVHRRCCSAECVQKKKRASRVTRCDRPLVEVARQFSRSFRRGPARQRPRQRPCGVIYSKKCGILPWKARDYSSPPRFNGGKATVKWRLKTFK